MRPVAAKSLNISAVSPASSAFPLSLFAAVNYYIFYIYAPLMRRKRAGHIGDALDTARDGGTLDRGELTYPGIFIFAAWAAFYVAMS